MEFYRIEEACEGHGPQGVGQRAKEASLDALADCRHGLVERVKAAIERMRREGWHLVPDTLVVGDELADKRSKVWGRTVARATLCRAERERPKP